jgi:galactosamine-6-phosphate isomerase
VDSEAECRRVEAYIKQNGGIDVAIIGLGLNGHIGMNEPGTPVDTRAHVSAIDPETQQTGQKYFTEPRSLSHGLTLGIATLMDTKNIFLMVSGTHKAEIINRVLTEPVSTDLPATILRNHPGATIYLDKAAAQKLQPNLSSMG